jgi:hypothetical protein
LASTRPGEIVVDGRSYFEERPETAGAVNKGFLGVGANPVRGER